MIDNICEKIPLKSRRIFGSGGSRTIIVITPTNQVYKFFPVFTYVDKNTPKDTENQLKQFKLEIEIQKKLTKQVIDKHLSPHVVDLIDSKYCKNKPDFFFKKCPSYKSYLTSKGKPDKECMYILKGHPVILKPGFMIAELSYCPLSMSQIIKTAMRKSNKSLENTLNRAIFQIVFTLAVIQKKFPYFVHHDCFMRNILATEENGSPNDYYRYCYGNFTFDVPVSGFYLKLNDFGLTNLNQKLHESPLLVKSPCEDIFNILYDMYDGGNLGTESTMSIAKARHNERKERFLNKYFSQFINVKQIREIIKKDKKEPLDWDWRRMYDPALISFFGVKEPKDYLKHFVDIYPKKVEHHIVETYEL